MGAKDPDDPAVLAKANAAAGACHASLIQSYFFFTSRLAIHLSDVHMYLDLIYPFKPSLTAPLT